ncbi:MAG: adenylyltransferase/cytidyltransferase family protein, partial [Planctomycetota bacterium]
SARAKILPEAELRSVLASHRKAGRRIIFTNGGFDLLHTGHVRALEDAAALGGVLVVGVNDDASIRAAKGDGRPVVPAADRAELVAALASVDYVVVFGDATVDRLLRELRPDVHAKGRDYTPDTIPERRTSDELGIEVVIVGEPKVYSSTQLLARAAGATDRPDRIVPVHGRRLRGYARHDAGRILARTGWLDLARLVKTDEGAVVQRHRTRFVRRLEVDGRALYVKITRPLEKSRSPIAEFQNHVALRAAGFRAAEPWLCLEGRVDRVKTGVLVTREAAGLALDEFLALALPEAGARYRIALARGIGTALRSLHTARFFCPDLQAWHIFVEGSAAGGRRALTFIDLARLGRGGTRVNRAKAAEGLAALAVSLRDVTPARFRLAILQAYLGGTLKPARPWLAAIRKRIAKIEHRGTFQHRAAARAAAPKPTEAS